MHYDSGIFLPICSTNSIPPFTCNIFGSCICTLDVPLYSPTRFVYHFLCAYYLPNYGDLIETASVNVKRPLFPSLPIKSYNSTAELPVVLPFLDE